MECIILAGGFGTRLKSVLKNIPKPMADISGKPFLDILLKNLARQGFKRIIFSVGYLGDVIINYFGKECYGMEVIYEKEIEPLGTGGAVKASIRRCSSNWIFVLNGDTFIDLDYSKVLKMASAEGIPFIVATKIDNTDRYGIIIESEGRLVSFGEKSGSGSGVISTGCYCIPSSLFNDTTYPEKFSMEADFLSKVIGNRAIGVFRTEGVFIDIGVPNDYFRAGVVLEPFF
jgi:D-glycero-alpha-D-manno-heptose 1-phosphate guanylyltransferase